MRICIPVAAALVLWATCGTADAGLASALNTYLEMLGAPGVRFNATTNQAEFIRLRGPTSLTLTSLTLESAGGFLTLPQATYPAGITLDSTELPYRLEWISSEPFEDSFSAGIVLRALPSRWIMDLSFSYAPSDALPTWNIGRGSIRTVVPEPSSILITFIAFATILECRRTRAFK
jgi:hypothetical protein